MTNNGKRRSLQERYYQEVAKEPYEFDWADRAWTMPNLHSLDYRIQSKIFDFASLSGTELETLFGRLLGDGQAEEWAAVEVPGDFLALMFEDWVEYSGESQGEDSASNDSSTNTGTNSRPTSGASTAASGSRRQSSAKRAPRKAASRPGNSST